MYNELSRNHDCSVRFLKILPYHLKLVQNAIGFLFFFFFPVLKNENFSHLLCLLKAYPCPTEMNTLLSDSPERDLLLENPTVKL